MTYSLQNLENWKTHFQNMAEGKKLAKKGKMYLVGNQKGHGDKPVVEVISPTQMAVEMAQSKLKRKREKSKSSEPSKKRIKKSKSKVKKTASKSKKRSKSTLKTKATKKKNHSPRRTQKRRTR